MCTCSRRDFVGGAVAAGGAMMAMSALAAPRVVGAPAGQSGTTKIHTLYLGHADPKWPCPTIDFQAERARYEAQLKNIAKIMRHRDRAWDVPVEFTGADLVATVEELERLIPAMSKADGLLVFQLAIPDGGMHARTLQIKQPMVCYFDAPSTAGFMAVNNAVRQGARAEMVYSSDLEEIIPHLQAIDAIRRMKQTTVLLLSTNAEKLARYNPEKMNQIFGVTFKATNFDRLNAIMQTVDAAEAARLADEFMAAASDVREPSRDDLVQAHKFYLAVKQLMREEGATVMTIDCLPGFYSGKLTAYPCVAWTRLMDDGLTGVCEADAQSTMMSLILQCYTGKPGFVSDPFFDTSQNTITYAHCVAATRMDGPAGHSLPYIIRSHMEDNKGVSIQVKMPVGQVLTTAQLLECDTVVYHTAKVVDNMDSPKGCRTKPVCKVIDPGTGVELSADKLMHDWQGPWHKVSWFGNYAADLARMSRLMGFKLVREV